MSETVKIQIPVLVRTSALFLLTTTLLLNGCTSSRIVQPLNQGQWQLAFNTGGPIIKGDKNTLPVALSSASLAYGFSQKTTGFFGMGVTTLFHNIYQMDVGFTQELLTPFDFQPGITITPLINIFRDKDGLSTKLYPQLDINSYWLTPYRDDFVYIGMSNWFEPDSTKAHGEKQNDHWIPAIHGGYTFQGNNYGLNLEMKYIAPNKNNQNQLIDYIGIENKGVLGVYLSFSRKFR